MSCSTSNSPDSPPWDTEVPSIKPALRLSVVVTITILVAILYILIYVQLLFILKRRLWFMIISYQTAFLFVNLLWASLRLSLYTIYFVSSKELVFDLPDTLHWLLVNFPTFLQFLSLALLVHYFGGVSFHLFNSTLQLLYIPLRCCLEAWSGVITRLLTWISYGMVSS